MRKYGIKRRQCEGGRKGRRKRRRLPNTKLALSARALWGARVLFCFTQKL